MSLSSKEAADSLSDVERAARRSAQAYGYSKASPHLILWGIIWVIGYVGTDLDTSHANVIWTALTISGCAISTYIGYRAGPANSSGQKNLWRMLGLVAIIFIFFSAIAVVFGHVSGAQMGVIAPLTVGAIYASIGLWLGARFVLTGLGVIALTLGGYFLLREHFLMWMALVGGGGLILAGFWLRKV
jgi:hypothetical protein